MNYEPRHISVLSSLLSFNKSSHLSIADHEIEEMLEEAKIHGVISLIYERLCLLETQMDEKHYQRIFNGAKNRNLSNAICMSLIHKEAFELINELNINGIQYIVLKGFALAYDTYSKPHLRPSVDIDIMIKAEDIERSKAMFLKKGFHNIKAWEPKEVHLQFTYSKPLAPNITCHFDIHREISNDHEVADLLPFHDIYNNHRITEFDNSEFKSISRPYAFIHASIHFLRHKYRKDMVRLIWLYDLVVVAERMSIAESEELTLLVKNKCISNIIIEAIDDTQVHFQSEQLGTLKNKIQKLPSGNKLDYLLDNKKNGVQRFIRQLKSTKSIRSSLILVWETLFPPKEQIYSKYGKVNNKLLWFYYAKRTVNGILKWVRK
jgi:hypothetical protein